MENLREGVYLRAEKAGTQQRRLLLIQKTPGSRIYSILCTAKPSIHAVQVQR